MQKLLSLVRDNIYDSKKIGNFLLTLRVSLTLHFFYNRTKSSFVIHTSMFCLWLSSFHKRLQSASLFSKAVQLLSNRKYIWTEVGQKLYELFLFRNVSDLQNLRLTISVKWLIVTFILVFDILYVTVLFYKHKGNFTEKLCILLLHYFSW